MTGRSEMNYSLKQITANDLTGTDPLDCPYHNEAESICSASLSAMSTEQRIRQLYCGNENYDNCPLFLSKMLRKRG
jgi:hypothetical protein